MEISLRVPMAAVFLPSGSVTGILVHQLLYFYFR